MPQRHRFSILLAATLVTALLSGCAAPTRPARTQPEPTQSAEPSAEGGASGTMLAPGLHEQQDGTAVAVGTLGYQTLEGGFWALIDESGISGPKGSVIAVIGNVERDDATYKALAGTQVVVTGKKFDGVSIRQAGPEIEATSIEPYGSGGPAD